MTTITRHVRIDGSGVAALTLTKILSGHEGHVLWLDTPRPGSGPTLLLTPTTLSLLEDVFGLGASLLRHGHELSGQRVTWGNALQTVRPVRSLAIDSGLFSRLLWDATAAPHIRIGCRPASPCAWRAEARAPSTDIPAGIPADILTAGRRRGLQTRVELVGEPEDVVTVETLPSGVLVLIPLGHGAATLQAVTPNPNEPGTESLSKLLRESRLVVDRIGAVGASVTGFSCAPALSRDLGQPSHIALDEAAVALDPLCADATGQAVRAGILAAAVIRTAGEKAAEGEAALEHYHQRLTGAFAAHLEACIAFYERGPDTAAWTGELGQMRDALAALQARSAEARPPQFRLEGYQLVRA